MTRVFDPDKVAPNAIRSLAGAGIATLFRYFDPCLFGFKEFSGFKALFQQDGAGLAIIRQPQSICSIVRVKIIGLIKLADVARGE